MQLCEESDDSGNLVDSYMDFWVRVVIYFSSWGLGEIVVKCISGSCDMANTKSASLKSCVN